MADNPPALTVRRNFPRPAEALVARLRAAPTGHGRARDTLAPYAALAFARPGDVLVVAADAYEGASVAGDILLGMAKNKGIAALVTDGMVRDVEGLNAVGIPVFARGLSPNSPYKDGPGEIGLPVALGGMSIDPGDLI